METLPKVTTADTNNIQPGELIHKEFSFYNVTPIHGFTSMMNVFCKKTIIMSAFPTAFKQSPA